MNNNNKTVFNKQLIRIPKVLELTGLSKSYIYQLQNKGLFPSSVQIVPNGVNEHPILTHIGIEY